MSTNTERVLSTAAADRNASVDKALEAVRAGRVLVAPSESVYLAVASGAWDGWETLGLADAFWLAPDVQTIIETTGTLPPAHRLLIERLLPGPAVMRIERPREQLAIIREHLGLPAQLAPPDVLPVRVTGNDGLAQLAGRTTLVATELAQRVSTVDDAFAALESRGIEPAFALGGGPSDLAKPASVIRLTGDGGFAIDREGAYEERFVRKQLALNVLFVCTGNTCRSPMAEAIARDLGEELSAGPISITIGSAGASAMSGATATPEAVRALEELGVRARPSASRSLSRQMIGEADVIFTMTGGHRQAVLTIDPGAEARVFTLDPSGGDIPDPIGCPQEVYNETARHLRELVAGRLKELIQ